MEPVPSAGASVPISLHEWIKITPCDSSYVEGAVDLALMLTKHLCGKIESWAESKLEDLIRAEDLVIYMGLPSASSAPDGIGRAPPVTGVRFRSEASGAAASRPDSDGPIPRPGPRSIGAALGEVLLEIFSRGKSSSFRSRVRDVSSGGGSGHPLNRTSSVQEMPSVSDPIHLVAAFLTQSQKRQAILPADNSGASTAKDLLVSAGMPLSICQLVCDLLDAENGQLPNPANASPGVVSDVALVAEALGDLMRMKTLPQKFLFDRTCAQQALDDTCLFDRTDAHFVGRARETGALTTARNNITAHVRAKSDPFGGERAREADDGHFLCEAVFLSGYAGSGKSTLIHRLARACDEDQWFVLGCKFDKQSAPHTVMTKAFNEFFGKWGLGQNENRSSRTPRAASFRKVCRSIFLALDEEGLEQLCDLVPNFALMFPARTRFNNKDEDEISMEKIGSAKKRLQNLFHVLVNSLCSAGHPVLFTFDDLQWSEFDMVNLVVNCIPGMSGVSGGTCQKGILVAGTYRSNEVEESGDLIQSIEAMKQSGRANVTMLTIGEMPENDINNLLSTKLCLPWRYTRELANLVRTKTRGNPFFVVQFLRSIIQNKMLTFSVKSRRWIWDCDVIDMKLISDGVAELLIASFSKFSPTLMQTVQILSCLGSQVEESTIDTLDSKPSTLSFKMKHEMPLAVREGIIDKAGPVYQFTHDIIQTTIYEHIPPGNRKLLHKCIGMKLLKSAAKNPTTCLLAADQINLFCDGDNPTQEESSLFANSNAVAAKLAMSSSSFEQARLYVDMGIRLLKNQHWETQYSLSLELFQMSASVSCMHGDVAEMARCLDELLSHARTFDDGLKASSMRIKLLASSSRFVEARTQCFAILSNLGEEFPQDICLPDVLNELTSMQTMLRSITKTQIKSLRKMTNKNKLNAMRILNILCMHSNISEPKLLPVLSCRMVKMTIEHGFCEDSIVGLATAGLSVFNFTEDIQLASQIGKVSDSLVEESPRKHVLRSRLAHESVASLKSITEPMQSLCSLIPELHRSAMLAGDIENAVTCRYIFCCGTFWIGELGFFSLFDHFQQCIKEAAKYQQSNAMLSAMGGLNACSYLSGRTDAEVDVKSFEELNSIAEKTNNHYLSYQIFMYGLAGSFWMREYKDVIDLSEKHSSKHPSSQMKRVIDVFRTLYEGVAYLSLARDTKQAKWKILGEKSVASMRKMEPMSKWNYENKSKLLQAELHYLEENIELAEAAYIDSIKSAHEHRFVNEEALACELYGIFCIENQMGDKGLKQLHVALEKYKQWRAIKKANELQLFIDLVDPTSLWKLNKGFVQLTLCD